MCSYMAMFPPTMPHTFIRWLTDEGEVVYDPFSGRGTTVLEACLLGRVGLGSDASPLACVLSAAKAQPPDSKALDRRLAALRREYRAPSTAAVPEHIRILFSKKTLEQLVWLRAELSMAQGHGPVPDGGAARDPARQCAHRWDAARTVGVDAEYVLDGTGLCVAIREDAQAGSRRRSTCSTR